MPILEIDGIGRVEVGNDFLSMSPQDQDAFVGEIQSAHSRGVKSSLGGAPQTGMGEAMGRGALQGATMYLGDEMAGAAAASPLPGASMNAMRPAGGMNALDVIAGGARIGLEKLFPSYFGGKGGEAYTAERDRVRAGNDKAKEDRPYSYGAGELGGAVATGLLTGNPFTRGASFGQKGAQTAAQGAALGAVQGAGDAKEMADVPGDALRGGIVGGIAGASAPVIASGLSRLVTPLPMSAERKSAVDLLRSEGIRPTAGQATGSKPLQWLESTLGDLPGAGGVAKAEQRGEAFTQAVMKRAGSTANRATQETIDDAFARVGQVFDDVGSRNSLRMDAAFAKDVGGAVGEYIHMVPPANRAPILGKTLNDLIEISRTGGTIAGDAYNAMRSRLDKSARSAMRGANSDPQLGEALFGLKNALDSAFERSISGADQEAIKAARRQYANLIPIAKASTMAGEAVGEGILSPANMRAQLVGQNRMNFARGRGELAELVKAGQAVMTPLPNSGTAPRAYYQGALSGLGALAGGSAAGVQGAILGLLAPVAAGRAIHSRPVQGYLANQVAAEGLPALGLLAAPLRQQAVSTERQSRQTK